MIITEDIRRPLSPERRQHQCLGMRCMGIRVSGHKLQAGGVIARRMVHPGGMLILEGIVERHAIDVLTRNEHHVHPVEHATPMWIASQQAGQIEQATGAGRLVRMMARVQEQGCLPAAEPGTRPPAGGAWHRQLQRIGRQTTGRAPGLEGMHLRRGSQDREVRLDGSESQHTIPGDRWCRLVWICDRRISRTCHWERGRLARLV